MVDDTETLGDLIATLGSIDDDEIDWQNVARTTVLIHQTFRYEYPSPIASLRQRLIVVPPDYHDDQRLLTHKLRVTGLRRGHRALVRHLRQRRARPDACSASSARSSSRAGSSSSARPGADGSLHTEPLPPDARFSEPSRLTRPDEALTAVAAELKATGATGLELAELDQRSASTITSATSGRSRRSLTTAAQAWAGGAGVCQDYAHCMLALARLCGLSARYVSGHLLGEGGTHAWVEILVPHAQRARVRRRRRVRSDPRPPRRAPLRHRRRRPRLRRRRPDLRHLRGSGRERADDEQAGRGHERRVPPASPPPPRRSAARRPSPGAGPRARAGAACRARAGPSCSIS